MRCGGGPNYSLITALSMMRVIVVNGVGARLGDGKRSREEKVVGSDGSGIVVHRGQKGFGELSTEYLLN